MNRRSGGEGDGGVVGSGVMMVVCGSQWYREVLDYPARLGGAGLVGETSRNG